MPHRHALVRHATLLTIAIAGISCAGADNGSPVETPPPAERLVVAITPRLDTLQVGASRMWSASVTTESGATRSAPVDWVTGDATIASVNSGLVIAIGAGTTTVIARVGTAADTATLVVRAAALELRLTPGAVAATLGDTIQFEASLVSPSGANTPTSGVQWQLSDSTAAAMVGGGSLATLTEGELRVTAQVSGVSASAAVKIVRGPVASITVTPTTANLAVGGRVQLVPTLRDGQGRVLTGRAVKWASSLPSVATVNAEGAVVAIAKGGAMVTATSEGKTATVAINVSAAPASAVTITLPNDSLVNGRTMQAVATPLDANGQPIVGRPVAWQSSNPSVATITNTGLIAAIAAGQTTISVICDGKVASQRLTVVAPAPATVAVLPTAAVVAIGAKAMFVAEVRDQFGTPMTGQAVGWSSQAPTVASVDATGQVTGISLGATAVRATLGPLSSSASVTVQNVPVASVSVAPTTLTLAVAQSGTVSVTARDAGNNVLLNRPVSWNSSTPGVATVSVSGIVTAVAPGSATVTATVEGKSASTVVTVTAAAPAPVASVVVALNWSTLSVGETAQAVAHTYDANAVELFGRTIAFSSATPALASVSATGLVTALAGGSTTVLATSEGQTGYTGLTIAAPAAAPVATVSLSAASTALVVGDAAQLIVQLRDAQGNLLTGRTITYSSSSVSVASVSVEGVVGATSPGSTTITATSGGKSATLAFTVSAVPSPAPVATVQLVLNSSTLSRCQGTQATATLLDSAANVLAGRPIAFSSSNTAVATVTQAGYVTAVGSGTAIISASSGGVSGSAPLAVSASAAVVASVTVSLGSSNLTVSQSTQATATAFDASGNGISGRPVSWSVAAGSNVASIGSPNGATATVTATNAGSTTVSATIDGVTGSGSLTVTQAAPPPPPPPSSIALPAPPQLLSFTYPVVTGRQWIVNSGGSLQGALNNAQRGDEVVLQAGATFTGNFSLPAKAGTAANGWIIIRSDQLNQLPPSGTRITPAYAALMPKIVTANTAAALATALSASGYWLAGVEITVSPAVTAQQYGIVLLGDGGSKQNSLSVVASDIVLDRVYVHGAVTTNGSRCIELNSARTAIVDSYIHECHGRGFDSQAIAGWNGPGPYKIVNNTLAGAGENIIFGGADPAIPNLIPSDIEIRRNYVVTPVSWKGVWEKKNLLETKNAQRMLIEGNVFDGSWADGQVGYAVLLKSANQAGHCTWCLSRDISFRYNYVRNVGAGFDFSGREGSNPYVVGALLTRVLVEQNIVENVNTGAFTGDARLIQLLQNASELTIRQNTMTAPGQLGTYITIGTAPAATDLEFSDNIMSYGSYGIFSSLWGVGEVALQSVRGLVIFTNVVMIGPAKPGYPNGRFVSNLAAASGMGAGADANAVNAATAGVIIP